MKNKYFEKELPECYMEAYHINAKDKKIGIIFNLIALVVMALVVVIAFVPIWIDGDISFEIESLPQLISMVVFLVAMVVYMILHELVHGIAYKSLTHEKLTFGLSWSCAFCGVPNIYTYRKTALIALVSPLITFTVILIPLCVVMYFVHPLFYLYSVLLFGLHLGGCSGDAYMTFLLLSKFKDKRLLMRDTGPEQFIYLPSEKDIENA